MRSEFLAFSPPSIGQEEIDEVIATLRTDWITTGPKVKLFEAAFGAAVQAPAALAVNSATAALHLGLLALGVGEGDAVISTPMTFASSIHVIEHVGARPVLADVDAETLNIDPHRVAEALESASLPGQPKALLPVHLYGQPCDVDALVDLARQHRLGIVEDAAHSLPATFGGRPIGSPQDPRGEVVNLTAFSFYATKNLTTAEGGMLTGPRELIDDARIWALHGMSRDAFNRYTSEGSWFYEIVRAGFKYNLTDISAALGLRQLDRLETFQARRREIVRRYTAAFSQLPELQAPVTHPNRDHGWHIYGLRLNLDMLTIDRARFIEELRARNIGASVHFIPIHLHPYYRDRYGYRPNDFPVAYREYKRLVSLPLHPRLTDADADDVIEAVADIVTSSRR